MDNNKRQAYTFGDGGFYYRTHCIFSPQARNFADTGIFTKLPLLTLNTLDTRSQL